MGPQTRPNKKKRITDAGEVSTAVDNAQAGGGRTPAPWGGHGEIGLYDRIAAGLVGAYRLAFGLSCLLVLTFAGFAAATEDHYKLFIFIAVAVLSFLICLATILVVERRGREILDSQNRLRETGSQTAPPHDVSSLEPYLKAIEGAIDNVRSLAQTRLIKEDLVFELTLLKFATGRTAGIAKLKGSYRVRNLGDQAAKFPFVAQVDVSENMVGSVDGQYRVKYGVSNDLVRDNRISFTSERRENGLSHIFRDPNPVSIEPGEVASFEWSTSEFEVRLPYCEFFTTAQPVFNMKIKLVNSLMAQTHVKAEVFRSADADDPVLQTSEAETMIDVGGVFLPYQGVLVRVYPT